jgi:integrase
MSWDGSVKHQVGLDTTCGARWFLESAWHAGKSLYAAFVLVLVLGLRRGEALGLAWEQIDLDDGEVYVGDQLQRVRHQLVLREVKPETSEAPRPLPELCVTALRCTLLLHQDQKGPVPRSELAFDLRWS